MRRSEKNGSAIVEGRDRGRSCGSWLLRWQLPVTALRWRPRPNGVAGVIAAAAQAGLRTYSPAPPCLSGRIALQNDRAAYAAMAASTGHIMQGHRLPGPVCRAHLPHECASGLPLALPPSQSFQRHGRDKHHPFDATTQYIGVNAKNGPFPLAAQRVITTPQPCARSPLPLDREMR